MSTWGAYLLWYYVVASAKRKTSVSCSSTGRAAARTAAVCPHSPRGSSNSAPASDEQTATCWLPAATTNNTLTWATSDASRRTSYMIAVHHQFTNTATWLTTTTTTSRLAITVRLRTQVRMPPVRGSAVRICEMMRTQHFWIRTSLSSTAAALHATIGGRLPEWHTSKCISSVSFVRIESNFLYNTQETQTQKKMMDQNFEIWILWFLRFFFKFSKRRHAVPLRPIWTIMVAAKLDQSRVLVTKFHQNRSTVKGRSAGQRHTHRQVKISTLQVYNRANWFSCCHYPQHIVTPGIPGSNDNITTLSTKQVILEIFFPARPLA